MTRPEPVECANFNNPADYPHGAPLLLRGRLQAGPRDATFVYRPDVRSDKASHVMVASHRYEVGGGITVATSACDTARIAIDTELRRDAAEVHPNGQCRRRGCRELFAQALAAASEAAA